MEQDLKMVREGDRRVIKEMKVEDRELLKASRAFQDLIHTDGWKYLVKILDQRQQSLAKALIFEDGDAKDEMERKKGAIRELAYVVGLPETTIAQAKQVLGTSHDEDAA
jgi:23S rRNA A2030 N6-methylase RlmJ